VRTEWRLFAGAAGFFAVTTALYWAVSSEHAGTVMLGASVASFALVGSFLFVAGRRHGPRPQDRADATHADGAGEVGYFPSSSVWPFALSVGTVLVALGVVFSAALVALGAIILAISVFGYVADAGAKP